MTYPHGKLHHFHNSVYYSQQQTTPFTMRFNNYSSLISTLLLHRTKTLMATTPSSSISNSISNIMDSSKASSFNGGGSQRLINLAQQLRLYKTPSTTIFDNNDEIEEQRREENEGKVVSQVGFVESSTPPIVHTEQFKPKKAAVLICLFEDDDGVLKVILTKRSSKLSTHSGEVSLPGGKAEEGDANDTQTAMREAKEEIGLEPSLVNVVTVLEPFLSKHLLRVVPVVGILMDKHLFKPAPNTDEVEAIFNAPLEMFLKDENRTYEEREWMGYQYLIHFFDYETENKKFTIWGLTAGILIRAASVVFKRPPSFEEQKPNFKIPKLNDVTTMP